MDSETWLVNELKARSACSVELEALQTKESVNNLNSYITAQFLGPGCVITKYLMEPKVFDSIWFDSFIWHG